MKPKMIAEWVSDIGPGRLGIMEDLYGFRVNAGDHPIDELIQVIERQYYDFDIEDPKVIDLAADIYEQHEMEPPTTAEEWKSEISSSSQNEELKEKLISMIMGDSESQVHDNTYKYKVYMKNGNIVEADLVKKVTNYMGTKFWYICINPAINSNYSPTNRFNSKLKKMHPEIYEPVLKQCSDGHMRTFYKRKFEHVLTAKHIDKIDRI